MIRSTRESTSRSPFSSPDGLLFRRAFMGQGRIGRPHGGREPEGAPFQAPEEGTYLPFLTELFGKASAPELAEALEESGATVTNISESEGTIDENGKFQKIRVQGTGSFAQIVRGFDIIKGKERWNAMDLKSLKREGGQLSFDAEIRTFQSRGTYEKEKYSSDRSHGDRKEPRGEDSR